MILCLYCSVSGNYGCQQKEPPDFFSSGANPYNQIELSYQSLALDNHSSIDMLNDDSMIRDTVQFHEHHGPYIIGSETRDCVYSATPAVFKAESGLRFIVCTSKSGSFLPFFKQLQDLPSKKPTNVPELNGPGFQFRVQQLASLKHDCPEPLISVDGSYQASHSIHARGLQGRLALQYNANLQGNMRALHLPRRFPRQSWHLLICPDSINFIYNMANLFPEQSANSLLVLKWTDPAIIARATKNLQSLNQKIQHDVARAPRNLVPQVTEYYLDTQARSYIQLNSNIAGTYTLQLQSDANFERQLEIYMPHQAALLLHISALPDFKIDSEIQINSRILLRTGRTSIRGRALQWHQELADFRPATYCMHQFVDICGRAGLPVDFQISRPGPIKIENCQLDDLEFSEWNPLGLRTAQGLQRRGKFFEFVYKKECNPAALVLLAGDYHFALPPGLVETGERLLIVADPRYFESNFKGKILSDYRIAYTGLQNTIRLQDSTRHTVKEIYQPADDEWYILSWGPTDPIHSLIPLEMVPTNVELSKNLHLQYSLAQARGLRPDLQATHSMSPGHAEDGFSLFGQPLIQEILPAGARKNDGSTRPDEEFLEFGLGANITSNADGVEAGYVLQIMDANAILKQSLHLPPFPIQSARRILRRKSSYCWPDQNSLTLKELRIPDYGLHFKLQSAYRLLQHIQINPDTARVLRGNPRRSIFKNQESDNWCQSSTNAGLHNLCNTSTLASPQTPAYESGIVCLPPVGNAQ